jgi:hypothetical protein
MQAIHELGHVSATWLTGGRVTKVVLHPLSISRTDVEPNPQPLIVAWGGPILGAFLPVIAWSVAVIGRVSYVHVLRFFAGFCLLANGIYLGVGSFGSIGDAGDILRLGAPMWTLWLFGIVTAPTGLALWNGLRPKFQLAMGGNLHSPLLTAGICLALAAVVAVELLFFGH